MTASPSHGSHDDHGAPAKKAAISGLALVGFFGLIVAGILLAVYASRYVPDTLARLSSAVYLSSDAAKNGKATTTPAVTVKPATPTVVVEPSATTSVPELPNETGYTPRTTTYTPPRAVSTRPNLYGYADLALTDLSQNYQNGDLVVRFSVKNVGTNIASGWRVKVAVERQDEAIAYGSTLNPNGYQTFTLRVTDIARNTSIRIDADYLNAVRETDESNNSRSLNASSGGGSTSSRDVSCNLDASDTRVDDGDRITLEWDTDGNPNYASINNGIGRVDEDGGTERVRITDDTTFRMTVRNSRGDEDTCSVTVRVN